MRLRPDQNRPVRPRLVAFSLVEMLAVVAIMLILFVAMFGFSSRSHQQTQQKSCLKNLQMIHVALEIFSGDHDGVFPVQPDAATSEAALAPLIPKYIAATAPFICPGSKDKPLPEGEPFGKRRISYAYAMGARAGSATELLMSDEQVDTRPKAQGQPVFSTNGKRPGNNHHRYGGNLLFCDGHAETISALAPVSLVSTQSAVLLNPRQP